MVIRPEPLTREAFRPFGDVIEVTGKRAELINRGHTQKYAELANLLATDNERMALAIYRSQPVEMPLSLEALERHPLGSQAFIPLHGRPFPVVVALPGSSPDVSDLRAFLSNGNQGFNLNPGVWHHYQISLGQESDYLVVDRAGDGNFEEIKLANPAVLQI